MVKIYKEDINTGKLNIDQYLIFANNLYNLN